MDNFSAQYPTSSKNRNILNFRVMTVRDPDEVMNAFVEKHILRAGLHYRQNPNLAQTKISKNVKPRTGVPKIGKNLGAP